MSKVEQTLKQRGKSYGSYSDQSSIAEAIQGAFEAQKGWARFQPSHRQAARMIAIKMARLLNGDPNHADSWHDIAGYATLAEIECQSQASENE